MNATPSTMPSTTTVVRLGRLEGAGPHAVSVSGRDLVVVRTAAGPRVFEGQCPHRGALLAEGEFDGVPSRIGDGRRDRTTLT